MIGVGTCHATLGFFAVNLSFIFLAVPIARDSCTELLVMKLPMIIFQLAQFSLYFIFQSVDIAL